MHIFGVKQAARLQNILCAVLAIAIASYICLGIGHIQPDYFTEGFMTKGVGGFILASIYLTFAAGGAQYVVNYSSVSKNPTKDIPVSYTHLDVYKRQRVYIKRNMEVYASGMCNFLCRNTCWNLSLLLDRKKTIK